MQIFVIPDRSSRQNRLRAFRRRRTRRAESESSAEGNWHSPHLCISLPLIKLVLTYRYEFTSLI
jgi:hypothetical protein